MKRNTFLDTVHTMDPDDLYKLRSIILSRYKELWNGEYQKLLEKIPKYITKNFGKVVTIPDHPELKYNPGEFLSEFDLSLESDPWGFTKGPLEKYKRPEDLWRINIIYKLTNDYDKVGDNLIITFIFHKNGTYWELCSLSKNTKSDWYVNFFNFNHEKMPEIVNKKKLLTDKVLIFWKKNMDKIFFGK